MSCIYEMNGMRDELKKFKEHIVQLPPQIYARVRTWFLVHDLGYDSEKPRVLSIGSHHNRSGLKIQISPKVLQRDSSLGVDTEATCVNYANSKLVVTNKTLAKLVYGYKIHDNLPELSKLLFKLGGSSLCADVVDACVAIGWLEATHDILDDMVSAGHPMDLATYDSFCSTNNIHCLKKKIKTKSTSKPSSIIR
ncbi:PREDICTED: pentatricopeptide repeat-containing protein At4g17616-like [Camelina sativa]|uniref:Pentatricopeptide repeat-containing protein At4g17616-like n=1 Tax=Camelina sativa TaxID=90675 RepID=A0ABM1RP72_CAMSA|nr:PREDICTED: pentatricopeptide repeat-containing protein At4g17616-like [Camelina sativa]